MTKLLIVTDHRFYSFENKIYDNYVFDYSFFEDYLSVFEQVTVMARVVELENLNLELNLSSGLNVKFIKIPDVRGVKWLLNSKKIINSMRSTIPQHDAYCFRIPSIASFHVSRLVKESPSIFELIGDPEESLININDSFFKKVSKSLLGKIFKYQTSYIVGGCVSGSYVSFEHLQNKFPIRNNFKSFTISSIRLLENQILPYIIDFDSFQKKLKIVHVGSFVAVKNQELLIEIVDILVLKGFDVKLQLIGDGGLKALCEKLVQIKKLENHIEFKGHVTGIENILSLLDESNIFILPSSSEGMPRSLLEAMARGLICFGSNRGGIPELLDAKFTFELESPNLIVEKIISTIKDTELVNKYRKKNLVMARSFEQSRLNKKRKELLNELKNNIK
jgi:glycosyltransferase involved in cell wall biosynthesis